MNPKVEIDLKKAEVLAGRGLSYEQIAHAMGINEKTLYNHRQQNAELAEVIKRGRAQAIGFVAGKLQQLIEDGNLGAIIFYLKAQGGWKETEKHEITGRNGNPIEIDRKEAIKQLTNEQLLEIVRLNEQERRKLDQNGSSDGT